MKHEKIFETSSRCFPSPFRRSFSSLGHLATDEHLHRTTNLKEPHVGSCGVVLMERGFARRTSARFCSDCGSCRRGRKRFTRCEHLRKESVASLSETYRRRRRASLPPTCLTTKSKQIRTSYACFASEKSNPYPETDRMQLLLQFLSNNFIPLGLITAILFGVSYPAPGRFAASLGLSKVATCGIFFISGLCLQLKEVGKALRSRIGLLYGLFVVLLLTPLAGIPIQSLPLEPDEFKKGLALFCCVPTSLTSAVTLTAASNGNAVLALALTIGTNFLGILTVPMMLSMVMGRLHASPIAVGPLIQSLVSTVLAPLVVGISVRALISPVASWADKNKKRLSLLSNSLLITTPWQQVSKSSDGLRSIRLESLLLVIAAGCMLHLVFLLVNIVGVNVVNAGRQDQDSVADRKALILVGSQKTLPVAVTVLQQIGASFGDTGLVIIPCVISHLMQILIDSWLVARWNAKEKQA